jgi:hypothetical protein
MKNFLITYIAFAAIFTGTIFFGVLLCCFLSWEIMPFWLIEPWPVIRAVLLFSLIFTIIAKNI